MTPAQTPRPQLTVTATPLPIRKSLWERAAQFSKSAAALSRRAVDLSWLAKGRDLLLLSGLALIVHAVHFWSATAAEALAGLMLLWLSWSMTPPAQPKPSPPTSGQGGRS